MTAEDSFMQIVRERLTRKGWRESATKPGLFYSNNKHPGHLMFIDMRTQPMRLYGYEKNNEQDTPLPPEKSEDILRDEKRMLVSIGCADITEIEEDK
jgi:hypothetical protein